MSSYAGVQATELTGILGHSTGRAVRAAGLFDDELQKNGEDTDVKSMVLTGGFNGWSTAGGAFDKFITP